MLQPPGLSTLVSEKTRSSGSRFLHFPNPRRDCKNHRSPSPRPCTVGPQGQTPKSSSVSRGPGRTEVLLPTALGAAKGSHPPAPAPAFLQLKASAFSIGSRTPKQHPGLAPAEGMKHGAIGRIHISYMQLLYSLLRTSLILLCHCAECCCVAAGCRRRLRSSLGKSQDIKLLVGEMLQLLLATSAVMPLQTLHACFHPIHATLSCSVMLVGCSLKPFPE